MQRKRGADGHASEARGRTGLLHPAQRGADEHEGQGQRGVRKAALPPPAANVPDGNLRKPAAAVREARVPRCCGRRAGRVPRSHVQVPDAVHVRADRRGHHEADGRAGGVQEAGRDGVEADGRAAEADEAGAGVQGGARRAGRQAGRQPVRRGH